MKYKRGYSRRNFIWDGVYAITLFLCGGLIMNGCDLKKNIQENKPVGASAVDPCEDLSEISKDDILLRQKLGYVKESPIPDNKCDNCNLFLPPGLKKNCGGCLLFKGPVYPSGYCTYWAPRV